MEKSESKTEEFKSEGERFRVRRCDLAQRTIEYSLRILKTYRQLAKNDAGRELGNQLLRSGTSIGANYHEAQGAQSKADFISKVSIAYKEALETLYWLRIMEREGSFREAVTSGIIAETEELIKIFSSILLTSKRKT